MIKSAMNLYLLSVFELLDRRNILRLKDNVTEINKSSRKSDAFGREFRIFEAAFSWLVSYNFIKNSFCLVPHPTASINSRHSPLLMPEVSCVTSSPFSILRTHSKALPERLAPPMR